MRRVTALGAVMIVLFVAFALRLYRLPGESIWWDEGHSIFVASHSLAAIPAVPAMDVHPPLYFWLLHGWMQIAGTSEFGLRFLSLCFGVLTVALMFRLGRDWLSSSAGLLAAGIACVSPLYLAYSQEVRMYALVSALSVLSVYFFGAYLVSLRSVAMSSDASARGAVGHPKSAGQGSVALALYAPSTAAALYSHYFVGFLIIFQNLFWLGWVLTTGRWRSAGQWLRWAGAQAAILVLLSPQIYTMTRQVSAYKNVNLTAPHPADFLRQLWAAFTLGSPDGAGAAPTWMAVAAGVLLFGLAARWLPRLDRSLPGWRLLLLVLGVAVPLVVYYAVLLDRASFSPRYMMVVTPALYLLLAYAIWQLGRRRLALGLLAGVALFTTFGLAASVYFAVPTKDDTRGLARWLEREASPRDIVFIDVPHPLDYYYHGAAPAGYLFVDIHTIADVLSRACRNRERLFWVRWRQSDTDPRGAVLYLLDKHGRRLGEKRFRGYDVVWYDLPKSAQFSLPTELSPTQTSFGNAVTLIGQAFDRGQGDSAWVALAWRIDGSAATDYRAGVYLRDGRGRLIGQDDRDLLSDRHLRTRGWTMGETAINVYTLRVPPGTPPGEYTVSIAVYRADNSEALGVLDERGAPQGTVAALGVVHLGRPARPPELAEIEISHRLGEPLNDDLLLAGYDLPRDGVQTGGVLPVSLYWQARRDVLADYRLRVALIDADGNVAVERIARPADGTYPTRGWRAGDVVHDRIDLQVPATLSPGRYTLEVALVSEGAGPPAARRTLRDIEVAGRARRFDVPSMQHALSADLGGQIELMGYDAEAGAGQLALTLYWKAKRAPDASYKVFTHLLGADRRLWGQKDEVPGGGSLPTSGWVAGEVIADAYVIAVDAAAPSGPLDLELGFYDPATGARLPVVDAAGATVADHVLVRGVYARE